MNHSDRNIILRLHDRDFGACAEVERRLDLGGPMFVVWTGPIDEATDELDRSFVLTRAHSYSCEESALAYAKSFVGHKQIDP